MKQKRNRRHKPTPENISPIQIIQHVSVTRASPVSGLINLRTGRVIQMSSKAATMLTTKYPKEFKIL